MQNIIQTPTWVAAAALGLALVIGGVTGSAVHSSSEEPSYTIAAGTRTEMVFEQGFSPVVRSAAPAVVNISSSRVVPTPVSPLGPADESMLRRFFGDDFMRQFRVPRQRRERSLGSGVIVNASGYVLTNSHVVEGASDIKVALSDKREMPGEIVGMDPATDIAVVKIDTDHLSSLPFADSSKVEVGDIALALGNPFGLGRTVTMGIVSAIGRGGLGIEEYEDFIQTDASINPGNSGGPLINVRGELIGINTAILSPSGGNLGIGFAVPSNMARTVMDQIIRSGKVTRGYLGIVVQDITPELSQAMNLGQTHGALISDIDPEGPAAHSGLRTGDVIVEANGKPIGDQRTLRLMVSSMAPGTQVNLRVLHEGQSRNLTVTLGELPPREMARAESGSRQKPAPGDTERPRLGIAVMELSPELAEHLGLPTTIHGVVIADIEDGSAAAEAGLKVGDVVEEVNRKAVRTVSEFRSQLAQTGPGPILLRVNRGGHHLFFALQSP
jgi:serine protease Do